MLLRCSIVEHVECSHIARMLQVGREPLPLTWPAADATTQRPGRGFALHCPTTIEMPSSSHRGAFPRSWEWSYLCRPEAERRHRPAMRRGVLERLIILTPARLRCAGVPQVCAAA